MFGVRGMTIGAALTFGAVLWWATRGTEPAAEGFARLREAPASHADSSTASTWWAAADKDGPAAAPLPEGADVEDARPASDASFGEYVAGKYRFLLATDGRAPRGSAGLRAALLARERILVAINTARQGSDEAERAALPELAEQLMAADRHISRLLPAADLAAFDALKDSHIEQFQLDDYARGIGSVAPLRDDERRAILYSKVVTRQRFRQVLDQSGLMRGDLTPAQRQAALGDVSRALRESRDSFLQEARQHLGNEEQYELLANYENSEYAAELEKLRGIASGS